MKNLEADYTIGDKMPDVSEQTIVFDMRPFLDTVKETGRKAAPWINRIGVLAGGLWHYYSGLSDVQAQEPLQPDPKDSNKNSLVAPVNETERKYLEEIGLYLSNLENRDNTDPNRLSVQSSELDEGESADVVLLVSPDKHYKQNTTVIGFSRPLKPGESVQILPVDPVQLTEPTLDQAGNPIGSPFWFEDNGRYYQRKHDDQGNPVSPNRVGLQPNTHGNLELFDLHPGAHIVAVVEEGPDTDGDGFGNYELEDAKIIFVDYNPGPPSGKNNENNGNTQEGDPLGDDNPPPDGDHPDYPWPAEARIDSLISDKHLLAGRNPNIIVKQGRPKFRPPRNII